LLTDLTLARKLRSIRSGVLISTRPVLHLAVARLARPGVVTIGQDHLNFLSRRAEPGSMAFIEGAARRGLDAFVTLTPSDALDYKRALAGTRTRVTTIPNALSWPVSPPRERDLKVVVAAGRLVPRKGMARLIRAFEPVARRHPDWELRIYGSGRLEPNLRELIQRFNLTDQVHLFGHTDDLPSAFDHASFFASASVAEGFPMVMLEALSKGLPLVSFDCPRGPGDIIRQGRNGILVPNDDIPALTTALDTLVTDTDLRRAMGSQSRADAARYLPERVAQSWDALFHGLGATSSAVSSDAAAESLSRQSRSWRSARWA
jgi:glycosyltransferase involved in cell wall biosynthesis